MSAGAVRTVLVAGSANLDFVVRAPHVPAPGETVLGREMTVHPGGKGANQAVASARAGGAPTRMLLALGADDFAVPLEASLRDAGVDLHIKRCTGVATGTAFICLADDAENAITVAPGANARLEPGDLPPLQGVGHLLMQLETPLPTVLAYARAARAARARVVLNAAPAAALPAELLGLLDILIVNEGELAAIAGARPGAGHAIAEALRGLDVPCVVVTLGTRGCCARDPSGRFVLQPAHRVHAVDTTGAGDTFCGALTASLGRGETLAAALRFAAVAAALATTRVGAQSGVPRREDVEAELAAMPPPDARAEAELAAYCGLPPVQPGPANHSSSHQTAAAGGKASASGTNARGR